MHGKEPVGDFGFVGTVVGALMITHSMMTIIHLLFKEPEGTTNKTGILLSQLSADGQGEM